MMIVYKQKSGNRTDTIFYYDYGRVRVYTGSSLLLKEIVIYTDTAFYIIWPFNKIVMKGDIKDWETIQKLGQDPVYLIKKTKSFKKTGSEEILGYKCNIYTDKSRTMAFWLWKNKVVLKYEMVTEFFGRKVILGGEAVEIKTDIPVPENIFTIPEDYEIESFENVLKETEKYMDKLESGQLKGLPIQPKNF